MFVCKMKYKDNFSNITLIDNVATFKTGFL